MDIAFNVRADACMIALEDFGRWTKARSAIRRAVELAQMLPEAGNSYEITCSEAVGVEIVDGFLALASQYSEHGKEAKARACDAAVRNIVLTKRPAAVKRTEHR